MEANVHTLGIVLLLFGGFVLRICTNAFTTSEWAATTTGIYFAVVMTAFYMFDPMTSEQKRQLLKERGAIQQEIDATQKSKGKNAESRKSNFVRKASEPVKFADDMYTDGLQAEDADNEEGFGKNSLTPGTDIQRKGKRERERRLYTGRRKGRAKRNTSATSPDEQEKIYADMNHAD